MAIKYVDIEYLRAQNANAGQLILAGSSNTLTYTQYVTVDVNGNVGIGTSISNSTLSVNGNIEITKSDSVLKFPDGSEMSTAGYPSYGVPGTIQFAGSSNVFTGDTNNLYWDAGNVRLGIGTSIPVSSLQVKYTAYESNSSSFTGTSLVVIDSFPATKVRSAQYFVQVTDETNSRYHTSQITVVQDGVNSYKSEYGIVTNGERLGDFDSRIFGGQLQLTFTAYVNTAKTVKITRTSMTA